MKPIIGILLRNEDARLYLKKELFDSIFKFGGIPIGIDNNLDDYLKICNGYIIPGGDDYIEIELQNMKKLYNLNKKVLGICLGHQTMGMINNGTIYDINNHKSLDKYVHSIIIEKNSLLYKIIGKEKIEVNSRHKSALLNTSFFVSAKSEDGVIEAIEDQKKTFFMGLQWHPESLCDINSQKIFTYFINICKG